MCIRDRLPAQWPNASAFLKTLREGGELGMQNLSLRSTAAYQEIVSNAIQAAIGGTDPQKALDQAASDMNDLTDRVGVDLQRDAYKAWIAGRGYPPES